MDCINDTPEFQIINVSEPDYAEVVTLDDIKKFSHVDLDYVSNNSTLEDLRGAAIEKIEGNANLYLAKRKVQIQFYGNACQLPYGPQPLTDADFSVKKNNETVALATDKYTISGLNYKTLIIGNGDCGCNVTGWFYPIWSGWPEPWTWTPGSRDFYNVVYNTGFGTTDNPLPKGLKTPVLMLIDYMIKEQGTTDLEIPPAIMSLVNRFSKNLIIQ